MHTVSTHPLPSLVPIPVISLLLLRGPISLIKPAIFVTISRNETGHRCELISTRLSSVQINVLLLHRRWSIDVTVVEREATSLPVINEIIRSLVTVIRD